MVMDGETGMDGVGRWLPSARFSDGSADASAAVFGATSLALAGDVSRLAVAAAGASSLVAPVVCSATAAGAGAGDLESLADMSGDRERRDDGEAVWMGRWCWLVQSGRSFGTVAALVTGGERGERAGPVFARHDRDGTRRVEGACSDKKTQGACSRDLVDGITMDWRGWGNVTWWRAQCAASRVGEQGRRWTMQGQSFLLNPVRSRRGRARNYLALAQRCSARGGPSVLGVQEWKQQGFWWRKLGDTSIHGPVHVGPCQPT